MLTKNEFLRDFWQNHCKRFNDLAKKQEKTINGPWPFRWMYLQYIKSYIDRQSTPMTNAFNQRF